MAEKRAELILENLQHTSAVQQDGSGHSGSTLLKTQQDSEQKTSFLVIPHEKNPGSASIYWNLENCIVNRKFSPTLQQISMLHSQVCPLHWGVS